MEIFCFVVSNQISFSFPLNWKKLMETQVRDHSLPKSSEQVLESVMTRDFSADVTAPLLITSITKTSMCYSNFKSVDEIVWCDHSGETSLAVPSLCTICFSVFYLQKILKSHGTFFLIIFCLDTLERERAD